LAFAASVAETATSRAVTRPSVRELILVAPVAVAIWLATRRHGAYEISTWGPLGLFLLAGAVVLSIAGRHVSRRAAGPAVALIGLGAWAAVSTGWGGVPDAGWTMLDQLLIAAAALAVGAMLSTTSRQARVVQSAVLLGLVAQGIELLARLGLSANPQAYFHGRVLYGLAGYQNAQAAILAIGIPPALGLTTTDRRLLRAAGAAAAVVLTAGVLLTESRGGLLALVVGVLIQIVWMRNARVTATALLTLAAAGVLIVPLRHVDAALFAGHVAHTIRVYVILAFASAAIAGTLAQISVPLPGRRLLAATALTAICILGIVGSVTLGPRVGSAWSQLTSDAPPNTAPGSTRLVSLSLNGRREAWRVAAGAVAAHPLLGEGPASFALRWTEKRRLENLYILQPHSLELELLSELGIVGIGCFLAFVILAYRGVTHATRSVGGVAGGVISIVLLQASYDWTWSFPGLVVPALLMVGAACGGGARVRGVTGATLVGAVIVVSAVAIAAPTLAARAVDAARSLQATNPQAAWSRAATATRLDPWDEEARATQASIAESVGEFALAARKYQEAAAFAQQPWADYYREALAWQQAGSTSLRLRACRAARAQNPLEPLLARDRCG
jgi:O-antigen ligase